MRVALYARVSTKDKDQDPETQLHALRAYAEAQEYQVSGAYVDHASATDLRGRRARRELLGQIHTGGWDAVLVLRLDRAFRSVLHMHEALADLDRHGKGFVSITQPIDTTAPMGRLLLNILGSVAEFERDLISQRTREGMGRARAQGRRIGRPPGATDKRKRSTRGYRARWAK